MRHWVFRSVPECHRLTWASNPPIFQPFTANQPQMKNTMRIGDNIDFVNEVESNQAKNPRYVEL